jgi:two-component system sensor histidine kinase YesM
MGENTVFKSPFKSLSVNVFLWITFFLLVPVYISFIFFKKSYEQYIQNELSSQIIASIQKGEDEFYRTFQKMINVSNVFTLDRELLNLLSDENTSYWDRNKRFDELIKTLLVNDLFGLDDIKITMFDNHGRNYANWSLSFYDYSPILEESWVEDSLAYKGIITWSLFNPSFIRGSDERLISLARSILNSSYKDERIATVIVSITEKRISSLLTGNDLNADFIRVCTTDTVEDVFAMNGINLFKEDDLRKFIKKTERRGSMLCELEGKRYLLSYYTLDSPWVVGNRRLVVLYFTDYQRITNNLLLLSRSNNYRMLLFLFILLVIIILISSTIARPIRSLSRKVTLYTQTRELSEFNISRKDEIGELNRAFLDMEIRINDLFEKLKLESEIREQYHFQALRAQINPHFLFNTLNTIRWMAIIRKADNIVDTINALSRILDYSMSRDGELAALKDELEMIQSYVHIQAYRYGEDMEVDINVGEDMLDCRIVKFILQPIVENSFIHAFKKLRHKKIILISGRREEKCLKLSVRDNGDGMNQEKIREIRERLAVGEAVPDGIGLVNVHRRIQAGYGGVFGLWVESRKGEGTVIEYILPLLTGGAREKTHGGR